MRTNWLCISIIVGHLLKDACGEEKSKEFEKSNESEHGLSLEVDFVSQHTFVALLDIVFTDASTKICTGAIIDDTVVITAAHCFTVQSDPHQMPELTASFVVIGTKKMFDSGYEQYLPIERIITHPDYHGWKADLSLVFTFAAMTADKPGTIIHLAWDKLIESFDTNITIISWGRNILHPSTKHVPKNTKKPKKKKNKHKTTEGCSDLNSNEKDDDTSKNIGRAGNEKTFTSKFSKTSVKTKHHDQDSEQTQNQNLKVSISKSKRPGRESSRLPGRGPGRGTSSDPGRNSGRDSDRDYSRDYDQDSGRDSDRDSVRDSDRDSDQDSDRDAGRDPDRDSLQDPGRDPDRDPDEDYDTSLDGEEQPDSNRDREPSHDREPYRGRGINSDRDPDQNHDRKISRLKISQRDKIKKKKTSKKSDYFETTVINRYLERTSKYSGKSKIQHPSYSNSRSSRNSDSNVFTTPIETTDHYRRQTMFKPNEYEGNLNKYIEAINERVSANLGSDIKKKDGFKKHSLQKRDLDNQRELIKLEDEHFKSYYKNWRRSMGTQQNQIVVEVYSVIKLSQCKRLLEKAMSSTYDISEGYDFVCYTSEEHLTTERDSGAPAVKGNRLVAITLGGVECDGERVAIGMKISCYCSWIASHIPNGKNLTCCTDCCTDKKEHRWDV